LYVGFQDEDLAIPWSGVSGEAVLYGNMYYPAQPMHHLIAAPVSASF